jgi:transposase
LHRRTIRRYQQWAATHGVLAKPLPPVEELPAWMATTLAGPPPPQTVSSVEPYREVVTQLHAQGVEGTASWQRLRERGYAGTLSSVYRFLHRLEPHRPSATVRVEREPGSEAQVDFGYAGCMFDPGPGAFRKTWAFVMTLAYSRPQDVEFVFAQALPTWMALHGHAFTCFGGVPHRVVLDHLKAGIVRACFDDPQVQSTYRECAEHSGVLRAPCRPRTPEHKGKVEQGGVQSIKRNFLGGRSPTLLTQANADVRQWCLTTAGQRRHGTTNEAPLDRFEACERAQLKPLPVTPDDLAVWKQVKLHRDGYVVFEQAFYSAPCRLIGPRLWVRGGSQEVRLYTRRYELVATHPRAPRPGARVTQPEHLPPEKIPGAFWTRENCRVLAAEVGPATTQRVEALLADPVLDRRPRVIRVLKLRERVGSPRLEAACARALHFGDLTYRTLQRILDQGLEAEALPGTPPPVPACTFVRTAAALLGALAGGASWSSRTS